MLSAFPSRCYKSSFYLTTSSLSSSLDLFVWDTNYDNNKQSKVLRFLWRWLFKLGCYELWYRVSHVSLYKLFGDIFLLHFQNWIVSETRNHHEAGGKQNCLSLSWFTFQPRRQRRYVPPKRRLTFKRNTRCPIPELFAFPPSSWSKWGWVTRPECRPIYLYRPISYDCMNV
jgi:hypothetical protein